MTDERSDIIGVVTGNTPEARDPTKAGPAPTAPSQRLTTTDAGRHELASCGELARLG